MDNFQEFSTAYSERMDFFNEKFERSLLSKVYSLMKRGIEIRVEDIDGAEESKTSLNEIFIEIPQVTEVVDEVEMGLDELEHMAITNVKVVFGEYGHGKSQTAQIALEKIVKKDHDADRIIHHENISTFTNFLMNFTENIDNRISMAGNESLENSLKSKLGTLQKAEGSDLSQSELISLLLEILQDLSETDFNIILFLDEVDKITHDKTDLTVWVDFFTALNDTRDLRLFLVLFLPVAAGRTLMESDTRMLRWEQFFEMEAIYLDGRYGKETIQGVANVLALGTLYNKKSLTQNDLQFVYTAYNYRKAFLQNSSLRKTNSWSLTTSEILNQCIDQDIWTKVSEFLERPGKTQKFMLENQMKRTLIEDRMPEFTLAIDDSEEKETYRVEFDEESLVSNGVFSDGQYKLFRRSTSSEFLEYSAAVVVSASIKGVHDDSTINDVVTMAESHPILFISLGLPQSSEEDLQARFRRLGDKYIQYFPISFINVPKELFGPLILVPTDPNERLRKLKATIRAWGTHITDHINEIQNFINTLPAQLIDRSIRLKTYELVKELPLQEKPELKANDEASKVLRTLDQQNPISPNASKQDKQSRLKDAGKFFGASLVAIIDTIKSYKYQSTIEKELRKMINTSPYGDLSNALFNILPNYLKLLEDGFYIETGTRGSQKIISTTDKWDDEEAINAINSKF